jgi:hypothetical protein
MMKIHIVIAHVRLKESTTLLPKNQWNCDYPGGPLD